MKNYNEIVSIARNVARDGLRLQMTNAVRGQTLKFNNAVSDRENEVLSVNKDIARYEFKKSQLVSNDPDFKEKSEKLDKLIEESNKAIDELNQVLEKYQEEITEKNEMIAKIQSGETKVMTNDLENETEKLLKEITNACAIEAALKA